MKREQKMRGLPMKQAVGRQRVVGQGNRVDARWASLSPSPSLSPLSLRSLSLPSLSPLLLLLLLLLAGVWLALAPAARAGEWMQVTCPQPNGSSAFTEGWLPSPETFGPGSGTTESCSSGGGSLTAFDSSSTEETAYSGPMWTYTAPAGSTIAGGTVTVGMRTPQGQAYVATPQNNYTSAADVLVNCQYNTPPCATSGFAGTVPIVHPGGTQLFMAAFCVAPTEGATKCPIGSGGGVNAEIHLSAADIELANGSTPTGTGFAGSLLAPNASGTASLTFSAHDPEGPGVYRVTVDVDGSVVYQGTPEANGGRCASVGSYASGVSEFLYPQPCKREVAVDVPVNTSKLSNGSHQLKVTVGDAADNTSVVYDSAISIGPASTTSTTGGGGSTGGSGTGGAPTGGSSTGGLGAGGEGGAAGSTSSSAVASLVTSLAGTSIGPGSSLSLRGLPNGTNASDQANLTARWTSTAREMRTSGYGAMDRISGRLSTIANVGIGGAGIDVYETAAYHGAVARRVGSVVSGPTGGWTLTLPRGVSSTALRFSYRSYLNDTVVAASVTLRLGVHAGVALKITPRVSSTGHRIFFSGALHGGPIPEGGKQLVLEARSGGGGWIQFNTIRTDRRGRFHSSYRFKFPGPMTYRFRVLSRYEADFPFLDGASNAVAVHEH